jgi:hypothetical protein
LTLSRGGLTWFAEIETTGEDSSVRGEKSDCLGDAMICFELTGSFIDRESAFAEEFDSTPIGGRLGRLTRYCARDDEEE